MREGTYVATTQFEQHLSVFNTAEETRLPRIGDAKEVAHGCVLEGIANKAHVKARIRRRVREVQGRPSKKRAIIVINDVAE